MTLNLSDPMAVKTLLERSAYDSLVNNADIIGRADSLDVTESDSMW